MDMFLGKIGYACPVTFSPVTWQNGAFVSYDSLLKMKRVSSLAMFVAKNGRKRFQIFKAIDLKSLKCFRQESFVLSIVGCH